MTTINQGRRRGEFLRGDIDDISFDAGTLLADQVLEAGTVLGQITNGTAVAAAGTNTGNGTIGAVTLGAQVLPGAYVAKITKAAANAGDFSVTDPQGDVVGIGTVAVAYNNGGLGFTIADGATDFVVGDTFTITVSGTGKWRALNLAGTDGSQRAAAILYDNEDATGADKIVTLVTRHQEVGLSDLIFPAGITGPQKTAALAQLAAIQIVAR